MTAKPLPIRWGNFNNAVANGYCSICDLMVAQYSAIRVAGEDGPPTTGTLNRGMVRGQDGIFRRSAKYRDHAPMRGRTMRKAALGLKRAGGSLAGYGALLDTARTPMEQPTRGESVESGTLLRCPQRTCGALLMVGLPAEEKLFQSP